MASETNVKRKFLQLIIIEIKQKKNAFRGDSAFHAFWQVERVVSKSNPGGVTEDEEEILAVYKADVPTKETKLQDSAWQYLQIRFYSF